MSNFCHPCIDWFSLRMERKLVLNHHKGHWKHVPESHLFKGLKKEVDELEDAMHIGDINSIVNECADIANYAMMIADNMQRMNVRWIIEDNIIKPEEMEKLIRAFEKLNINYDIITIIPFENKLPELIFNTKERLIFYGSTKFLSLLYQREELRNHLYFDPLRFNERNQKNIIDKSYFFNHSARITTFGEHHLIAYPSEYMFVKPIEDKLFDGSVMSVKEIPALYDRISKYSFPKVDQNTEISISPIRHIDDEYRVWIVDGRIITYSKYKQNGKPYVEQGDLPQEVIEKVMKVCKLFSPSDVFAIDIHNDKYHGASIIEYSNFHCAGFYGADVVELIKAVTNFTIYKETFKRYSDESLNEWWLAECEKCGWEGLSRDCNGGGQIGDTGDYDDPRCPKCENLVSEANG